MRKVLLVLSAVAAAGCTTARQAAEEAVREARAELGPALTAEARLLNAQGVEVGTAILEQHASSVEIDVQTTRVPPGVHGIHVHAVGTCTGPDFASAGGHFNPDSRDHGFDATSGPHAGDLRNFEVRADGTGRAELTNDRISLAQGATSLFDADGSSVVVHAAPDDYRTNPAGNSGARIACGVIRLRSGSR